MFMHYVILSQKMTSKTKNNNGEMYMLYLDKVNNDCTSTPTLNSIGFQKPFNFKGTREWIMRFSLCFSIHLTQELLCNHSLIWVVP